MGLDFSFYQGLDFRGIFLAAPSCPCNPWLWKGEALHAHPENILPPEQDNTFPQDPETSWRVWAWTFLTHRLINGYWVAFLSSKLGEGEGAALAVFACVPPSGVFRTTLWNSGFPSSSPHSVGEAKPSPVLHPHETSSRATPWTVTWSNHCRQIYKLFCLAR